MYTAYAEHARSITHAHTHTQYPANCQWKTDTYEKRIFWANEVRYVPRSRKITLPIIELCSWITCWYRSQEILRESKILRTK